MTRYPLNTDEKFPRQEFSTTCPNCRRELNLLEEFDGKDVACPFCSENFTAKPDPLTMQEQGGFPEKTALDDYKAVKWLENILIVMGVLSFAGGFLSLMWHQFNYPDYPWWSDGLWIIFSGFGFFISAMTLKLMRDIARNIAYSTALKERELKNRE